MKLKRIVIIHGWSKLLEFGILKVGERLRVN